MKISLQVAGETTSLDLGAASDAELEHALHFLATEAMRGVLYKRGDDPRAIKSWLNPSGEQLSLSWREKCPALG